MTTVYDHRTTPPTSLTTATSCVTAPGYVSAPLANLPEGLYLAGPDDPVPSGMVAVAWTRVIRDGKSVNVPTCEAASAPAITDLRAAALVRYHAEAAACIARDLPAPWDVLRDVATPEFHAWAETYLETVAAELARLEAAVAAAESAEALSAIVSDWPEVTA